MADDIVARLRQMARANGCEAGRGCSEAADVIERLWAEVGRWVADFQDVFVLKCKADDEIERLHAAGDALADAAIRQQWSRLDVAVAAWQEARRG